jgi:predicted Zn-dependent protease
VRRSAAALLVLGLAACSSTGGQPDSPIPYRPNRWDYTAFRAAWPELLEPNYLPFMVHRAPVEGAAGDLLFFCRWPADAMPLPVYVASPEIPPELQDEIRPREPRLYVEAVKRALATWEDELEDLVRFRIVTRPRDAKLTLRLIGEQAPAPHPDLQVLGLTPVARGCRVGPMDPDAERLEVSFEVPTLQLYIADQFGLLQPGQVEWTALHEIGHALGMRSHSPIPADLMFEVARDRALVADLSTEDVNSFITLYGLPNGTIFGRVPLEGAGLQGDFDPGPPELSMGPYVDARLGFEFHPPRGWMSVTTAQGMAAVDGVTWDYTASLQIVVHRFATIEDYLARWGAYYLDRGRILKPVPLVVNGRRSLQLMIEDIEGDFVEEITLIEIGDGRLMVFIADCPLDAIDAYRPWFQASLTSLEITEFPGDRFPWERGGRSPAP